ncbi:Predicted oxidoreductase [Devosia crocina]|uniref:Predicted oxidoreductase n=1 Tax=Devosia crocina TaxID=429728 RepID=A0A1I7NQI4_9HYPH|nr:aldo/keto reductase [Devosia crocina]SFV36947.1 Predicted oxidoreductase [Devosia crocina]
MAQLDAALAGTFAIGGELEVNRLGFGAMRITGKGIWGPPEDRDEAIRVLKRLPELNVNFIDTAESYGPYISEELIAEALAPYDRGSVIATKCGLTRTGPEEWHQLGRPEFLRQGVMTSLRRLKLERLDLWQLHRIDSKTPRADQFGAIADMQKKGLIRHVGLSEVSVDDIKEAQQYFSVATVQNLYNFANRKSEAVLDYCEKEGIGFIPWFPLAGGDLVEGHEKARAIMDKHGASGSQIALAWLLKRSPVVLPIPGTGKVRHLEDNVAAAAFALSDEDFATLDAIAKR